MRGMCSQCQENTRESSKSFSFLFFFKFFYQVINLNEMKDFETRFLL